MRYNRSCHWRSDWLENRLWHRSRGAPREKDLWSNQLPRLALAILPTLARPLASLAFPRSANIITVHIIATERFPDTAGQLVYSCQVYILIRWEIEASSIISGGFQSVIALQLSPPVSSNNRLSKSTKIRFFIFKLAFLVRRCEPSFCIYIGIRSSNARNASAQQKHGHRSLHSSCYSHLSFASY